MEKLSKEMKPASVMKKQENAITGHSGVIRYSARRKRDEERREISQSKGLCPEGSRELIT